MVDFLYGMDWRRFVEEKRMKMLKSNIFLAKTSKWYRYPSCSGKVVPVTLKLVPVPIGSEELVPVPVKVVLVPLLPANLNWHIFAPLSPIFVHDCLGTLRND